MITDSISALESLKIAKLFADINYIIYEMRHLFSILTTQGCRIVFIWTPSQAGILGNESADYMARTIVIRDISSPDNDVAIHLSDFIPTLKKKVLGQWNEDWQMSLARKSTWCALFPMSFEEIPGSLNIMLEKVFYNPVKTENGTRSF